MNTAQQKTQTTTVPLSSEDRARMARLFEETSGRFQEMALITARTLGMDSSKGVRPRLNSPETAGREHIILVVCDDQGNCGCYDYEAGTCGPC